MFMHWKCHAAFAFSKMNFFFSLNFFLIFCVFLPLSSLGNFLFNFNLFFFSIHGTLRTISNKKKRREKTFFSVWFNTENSSFCAKFFMRFFFSFSSRPFRKILLLSLTHSLFVFPVILYCMCVFYVHQKKIFFWVFHSSILLK